MLDGQRKIGKMLSRPGARDALRGEWEGRESRNLKGAVCYVIYGRLRAPLGSQLNLDIVRLRNSELLK